MPTVGQEDVFDLPIIHIIQSLRCIQMALISCPECGSQVSSMAIACPQCGCPISPTEARQSVTTDATYAPQFPEEINFHFYADASGWLTPTSVVGKVMDGSTAFGAHAGGRVTVRRKLEGIWIQGLENDIVLVHHAQIANVNFLPKVAAKEKKKSVVGRALIGGILLGPLGAVVGGMSGVGSSSNTFDGIAVTYWDMKRSVYSVLAFESENTGMHSFFSAIAEGAHPFANLHLSK